MIDTRVKICGITSAKDAQLSLSMGADYLGLVFADSRRRITPDVARSIRDAVPDAMLVGVFRNHSLEEVVAISRSCRLNMIQLHGDEPPNYCDALIDRLGLPTIKAFSSSQLDDIGKLNNYKRATYFLFDLDKGVNPATANGTRDRLWREAAAVRGKGYRIFLAGGLTPSNVVEAVSRVTPYCIDVASGVEKTPGVKDSAALRAFVKEVKG